MRVLVLLVLVAHGVWAQEAGMPHSRIIRTIREQFPSSEIRGVTAPKFPHPAAEAGLRITGLRYDAMLRRSIVRMECTPRSGCLPFLVEVEGRLPETQHLKFAVRAGEHRPLIAEVNGVRVQRTVTCLQPGRAGEWIRVRPVGGDHVIRAQVQSSGELTAGVNP